MDSNIKLPKENKAQIEEIRELENKTPSYEEFVRNYKVDKKVKDSYQGEFDSYSDVRIGRSYGPGNCRPIALEELFDEEQVDKLSRYISRYLVSRGINLALGPLAPLSISIGEVCKEVSGRSRPLPERITVLANSVKENDPSSFLEAIKDSPNNKGEETEFMKWLGDLGEDLAGDQEMVEAGSEGLARDIASGANSGIAKSFWGIIDELFNAYGIAKDAEVGLKLTNHFTHLSERTHYDSDCDICKA